jgi:hypothetical protein
MKNIISIFFVITAPRNVISSISPVPVLYQITWYKTTAINQTIISFSLLFAPENQDVQRQRPDGLPTSLDRDHPQTLDRRRQIQQVLFLHGTEIEEKAASGNPSNDRDGGSAELRLDLPG